MNGSLEYIESYFKKELTDEEKQQFEARFTNDKDFAKDVAFYVNAREAARQKLLEEKKKLWAEHDVADRDTYNGTTQKRSVLIRWLPYVAAACLLIAVLFTVLYNAQQPQRLAEKYVQQELTEIGHTMDGGLDSLQQGIAAYNKRDYDKALLLFDAVYRLHPERSDAKKYMGFVYLVREDYDNALRAFDELAGKNLFSNPGLFLKAVTLLKRNRQNDKERAKELLQQVVQQNLEGRSVASKWLNEW